MLTVCHCVVWCSRDPSAFVMDQYLFYTDSLLMPTPWTVRWISVYDFDKQCFTQVYSFRHTQHNIDIQNADHFTWDWCHMADMQDSWCLVSDIAIFVLKRDVKLQLTDSWCLLHENSLGGSGRRWGSVGDDVTAVMTALLWHWVSDREGIQPVKTCFKLSLEVLCLVTWE